MMPPRSYVGLSMVFGLMAITLYMAFAFPYTLLHLKQTETTEIKSVIIIGMNGEPSPNPDSYYIGEEPPEELHTFGYEQLTNIGKERMYLLGKFLKLRYYHLLLNGNPRKIYIRSADSDRYLESAQSLLAGLNPPKDRWFWSKSTNELNNWQPKAIHTTDPSYDDLLSPEVNCFKLEQERLAWKNSTKYQQLLNEFRHDMQTLRSNTGLEFEDDLEMLSSLEDSLKTRMAYGDNIPAWYTSTFANRLAHIADVATNSRYASTSVQRLYVGRILHEIVQNVNTKILYHKLDLNSKQLNQNHDEEKVVQQTKYKSRLTEPDMFVYMTDKHRLASLMSSLQIYSSQPYFGSMLIIELHYDPINEVHFLRLFTVSSTSPNSFPEPLRVNPIACVDSPECAPQQFEQNIRHLMLDKGSWQESCLNNVPTTTARPLMPLINDQINVRPATTTQSPTLATTLSSSPQTNLDTTTIKPINQNIADKLDDILIVGPTKPRPQLEPSKVSDASVKPESDVAVPTTTVDLSVTTPMTSSVESVSTEKILDKVNGELDSSNSTESNQTESPKSNGTVITDTTTEILHTTTTAAAATTATSISSPDSKEPSKESAETTSIPTTTTTS